MAEFNLKRLLRRRASREVVRGFIDALPEDLCVEDIDGGRLLGVAPEPESGRHSIVAGGETVGVVSGGLGAEALARLVGHLLEREWEKRGLAVETLDRYKELTLLYDIAEKLSACLDAEDVARVSLEEAKRFLNASDGSVLLFNQRADRLEIISQFGEEFGKTKSVPKDFGIAGSVFETGQPELVEDVSQDPRYTPADTRRHALMCAPLRSGERVLGLLRLAHREATTWAASDLKLVGALAGHAGAAIENALLHQSRMREQKLRSHIQRYISADLVPASVADFEGSRDALVQTAVLFCDLHELAHAPEDTGVTSLEHCIALVVEALLAHGATVNKLLGDMIVGLFVGPEGDAADVVTRAVKSARVVLRRLSTQCQSELTVGIGITATEIELDEMGVGAAAIHAPVNRAAALQGLAAGPRIVVDASVVTALGPGVAVASIDVAGKSDDAFCVVG